MTEQHQPSDASADSARNQHWADAPDFAPVATARPTASRRAGLDRLEDFLPRAGRTYADRRNFDFGPDERSNVSNLSPYLRRRILTEEEVVRAVLEHHRAEAAGKFLQEVFWRTYWKGWLELRPAVWADFLEDHRALEGRLDEDDSLRQRVEQAVSGRTGIECFDFWARELQETGILHNHARMWFASIWIFTLELPWVLGAAFFYRHLLDADPASNTLSWRWVAGLHTRGKFYVARASNIRKFTDGRFDPEGQLNESPEAIVDERTAERRALPEDEPLDREARSGWLWTEDDLHVDMQSDLHGDMPADLDPGAVAILDPASPLRACACLDFSRAAMADLSQRLARPSGDGEADPTPRADDEVVAWAKAHELDQVVTYDPGVGETSDRLRALRAALDRQGTRLVTVRRAWDTRLFPHAVAGYFRFRKRLPEEIERLAPS